MPRVTEYGAHLRSRSVIPFSGDGNKDSETRRQGLHKQVVLFLGGLEKNPNVKNFALLTVTV